MTTHSCPGCGSGRGEVFYELAGVPVNSYRLLPSRKEAVALPRGNLALAFCNICGLVFNAAFDLHLARSTSSSEEADACSKMSKAFQQRLADQLIERYALHRKHIVELGCGRGSFLALLCALGANRGIRLDPAYAPDPQILLDGIDATFRREQFTEHTVIGATDLVYSKMLLERVADPAGFLALLQRALGISQDPVVLLQVSNVVRTLERTAFWEFRYPQRCYFSLGALHRLLDAQGYTVLDMWLELDGQYLMADSRAHVDTPDGSYRYESVEPIADLANLVARFAYECREKQAMWCEVLRRVAEAGNRVAIWGAGSRTVSFLTTLAVGDEISYVIDNSTSRQGKYIPGTGHRVLAPDVMADSRPDVLIVVNSVLTFEIREVLAREGWAPTLLIA